MESTKEAVSHWSVYISVCSHQLDAIQSRYIVLATYYGVAKWQTVMEMII